MKIRSDFVTNSSSTSFIIITTGGFERSDLLQLMGVSEDSPLLPLFDALYDHLRGAMHPPREYLERRRRSADNWLDFVRSEFGVPVAERIVQAQESEAEVYIGELSSDSDPIESFFCVESFEVENDKIYLNALDCAW